MRSYDIDNLTIYGLQKDREHILSTIQSLGVMQPTELKVQEDLAKPKDIEVIKTVSDHLLRVSHVHSVLGLVPGKKAFVQNILGLEFMDKISVEKKETQSVLKESTAFLESHEKEVISLEEELKGLEVREEELKDYAEIAQILNTLGLPIRLIQSSERLSIASGRIATEQIEPLRKELETEGDCVIITNNHNKNTSILTVACLTENSSSMHFILKKYNTQLFSIPEWGIKQNPVTYAETELKSISKRRAQILDEIKKKRKEIHKETVLLREELEVLKTRLDVIHGTLDSEKIFVMKGYVLHHKRVDLMKALSSATNGTVHVEHEPAKGENVPVKLNNKAYAKPFEFLTELYALPKYKDLDPTFIIGPMFLVFAAFMLTDAVYGLLLCLFGVWMYKKFGPYNEGMKNGSLTIALMGGLTTFFGILTGSYFGDFPKYIFGITSEQLAFWRDPLADPLYFLIVSIAVAVVYLNIGFVLGLIEDVRKKDYKALVKDRVLWFAIQIGIALLALGINPPLFGVGLATLIIGASVLGIVIMHGPLGLLDITGLMGDMISFSRLFALSLSTAGIALAVNLLAGLVVGTPYVGIFLAALIFIIGHGFGFVMNSIGSFVHSLRLQFVEFFGRFYEGGGDSFEPLKEERYYTEVKK